MIEHNGTAVPRRASTGLDRDWELVLIWRTSNASGHCSSLKVLCKEEADGEDEARRAVPRGAVAVSRGAAAARGASKLLSPFTQAGGINFLLL